MLLKTKRSPTANRLLIDYVQECYDRKKPISHAREAILAVQWKRRHLKGKLRMSWDSIESWQIELELLTRLPIPELVLEAAFCLSMALGFCASRAQLCELAGVCLSLGIMLLVGFGALLRPGEMFSATAGRMRVPPVGRRYRYQHRLQRKWRAGSVHIPRPKMFRSFGRSQFATFSSRRAMRWVAWALEELPRGLRLFTGSGKRMSELFSTLMSVLGLSELCTLGSIRPGSATAVYMKTRDVTRVRFMGRWKNDVILGVYLQEAVSAYMAAELPDSSVDLCVSLVRLYGSAFRRPPESHWSSFFTRIPQARRFARGLTLRTAHERERERERERETRAQVHRVQPPPRGGKPLSP